MEENPDRLKRNDEEVTDLDQNIVHVLNHLLQPIRDDIKDLLDAQRELKDELSDNKWLREEDKKLNDRIYRVECENQSLSKRVCNLEDKLLGSNIVFQGIQESTWESELVHQEKIYRAISETIVGRTLDERLDIARGMVIKGTTRIGEYRSTRTRPISVEFLYKSDAEYILNNKKYLGKNIFVDREYCKETEESRRILRPCLRAACKMPKYHRKCRLDGGELIIRGISYSKDDLHKLPKDLSGYNISIKRNKEKTVLGFVGSINPFSNFHKSLFNYNGKVFHSGKQFIQFTKAEFFNDKITSNRI